MHAIRQYELGGPEVLRWEEVPDPEPADGQVRIRVEAAGVHLVDTSIRSGSAGGQLAPQLPMTPGREVAGRVDKLGANVDEAWLGRRVVAHLGMTSGGYAEQAVAAESALHVIPGNVDAATAVAAIGSGRTATGVLDIAPMGQDDIVLVTAASGGLGSILVREGRRVGATVVGLAGGPHKVSAVRQLGAHVVVDYREDDWETRVLDQLDGRRPTLAYDGIGGETSLKVYRLLATKGVMASYTGADPTDYDDPDRELRSVLGPAMTAREGGMRSLEEEALARAADGTRVPFVGTIFKLREAADAHRALEERSSIGKLVLLR
jgi:NADPH2:quinone reductase